MNSGVKDVYFCYGNAMEFVALILNVEDSVLFLGSKLSFGGRESKFRNQVVCWHVSKMNCCSCLTNYTSCNPCPLP